MELRDYLIAARRRWWIIVAAALVGAMFAWITAPSATAAPRTLFQAIHTLTVEPEARVFTPENPETIAILATSGEMPIRVAARVDADPGALLGRVTVVGDGALGVVTITAKHENADRAEELADGYALELVGYLDEQEQLAQDDAIKTAAARADQLDTDSAAADDALTADPENEVKREERDALLRQFSAAYERYNSLLSEPRADSGLKSLGPALASEIDAGISAPRSRTQRSTILGIIGALLGLAAAIALQRIDTRLASKEEAESAFGMQVIAEIPTLPYRRRRLREVIGFTEPASPIAEAYRVLRTTMMIIAPHALPPVAAGPNARRGRRASDHEDPSAAQGAVGGDLKVFLVTSTRPSEGKTTTVVNLAASFAEAGRSVLVIGADTRRPEVHHYFGVHREPGLTDVLRGGPNARSLEQVIVPTAIPGVRIVPAGGAVTNPGELLLDGPSILAQARELADIVLVDSTPMLTVNDAIQLMPGVDAVLLVSRANRTTVPAARRAHEMLARVRVPVCGVVLVGAPSTPGVSAYYYGYQTSLSTNPLSRLRELRHSRGRAGTPPAPPEPSRDPSPVNGHRTPTAVEHPVAASVPAPPPAPAPPPRTTRTVVAPPPEPTTNGAEHPVHQEPDPWGWP